MKKQLISVLSRTGTIRTATFRNVEHIVVPVVALVEGVIQASNSEVPELVLASELATAPSGWDGSPVVVNHPVVNGVAVSANIPQILESQEIGKVFNTALENNKLVMDAYINPEQVTKVGEKATAILERLQEGETIEVSVGAFIKVEEETGEYEGVTYHRIWREIVPDHLAFLSEGTKGACSVDMGCGTPRAASIYMVKGASMKKEPVKETKEETSFLRSMATKFRSMLTTNQEGEGTTTDVELRDLLDRALREVDSSFAFIEAVQPEQNVVIYGVWLEDATGGGLRLFKRDYSKTEDGVKVGESKEEVRGVTRYEPLTAASDNGTCACGNKKGQVKGMEKATIDRLIAAEGSKLTEDDRTWLETTPEEKASLFEVEKKEPVVASATEPKEEPKKEPVVASATEPKEEKEVTTEQYIADAPPAIRDALTNLVASSANKKTELVKGLRALKDCPYSEDELNAMTIPGLEQLSKIAGLSATTAPATFGGRGAPREVSNSKDDAVVPAAPNLHEQIRNARKSA